MKKIWRWIISKDINPEEYKKEIATWVKEISEFVLSLDERQLKYYDSLEKERLHWDLIRLEKRVHELEQKNYEMENKGKSAI